MSLPSFYPSPFKIQKGVSPEGILSEEVFTKLYAYMADESEAFEKKSGVPLYSIYIYNPECLAHFVQMLEFAWNNAKQATNVKDAFVQYLKNEGIEVDPNYSTITITHIIQWMGQSKNFYQREHITKLCISTVMTRAVLSKPENRPTWTKSVKKIAAKLKTMGINPIEQITRILEPIINLDSRNMTSPAFIALLSQNTHYLHACIVFERVKAKGGPPLDMNFESCFDIPETTTYYQDVMKKLSQQFSVPFLFVVRRVDILKTDQKNVPYRHAYGNVNSMPTLELGFQLMELLSFDLGAVCYSLPILWNYFQNMAISASPVQGKHQVFPQGTVFGGMPQPTHCMGIILKNMTVNHAYMRFLLLEVYPLIGRGTGLLNQLADTFTRKFANEVISWTSHFQKISFLHSVDKTMPHKLQLLSHLGFNVDVSHDCFVPLIDVEFLQTLNCYKRSTVFPLMEIMDNLFPDTKQDTSLESLHFINLANMMAMMRYTNTLKERTRLFVVENPYTRQLGPEAPLFQLIREYYITVLKYMPLTDFYNKDNSVFVQTLLQLKGSALFREAFKHDLNETLSYNCSTFPFTLTLSQFSTSTSELKFLRVNITERNMVEKYFEQWVNDPYEWDLTPVDKGFILKMIKGEEKMGRVVFEIKPLNPFTVDSGPRHVIIEEIQTIAPETMADMMIMFMTHLHRVGVIGPILSIQMLPRQIPDNLKQKFNTTEDKTKLSILHRKNFYWRVFDRTSQMVLRVTSKQDEWVKSLSALATNRESRSKLINSALQIEPMKEPWYYITHVMNEIAQLLVYISHTKKRGNWIEEWKKQLRTQDEFEFFTYWSQIFPLSKGGRLVLLNSTNTKIQDMF